MRRCTFEAHYGQPVELDLCAPCHLVWFDSIESARIAGASLLDLLREFDRAHRQPHEVIRRSIRCPRCAGALREVHNRTRFGRSVQLECARRHGAYQTFAQVLAEKGLVRPPATADRRALLAQDAGSLACLNCGASIAAGARRCGHCQSPVVMFDVARLASALDPEGATAAADVHRAPARRGMSSCPSCGAGMQHDASIRCHHCGITLAVGRLPDALAALAPLEAALREHRRSPAPQVRLARLKRLQGDLERRRDWSRELEASARADRARAWGAGGGSPDSGLGVLVDCVVAVWRWWRSR